MKKLLSEYFAEWVTGFTYDKLPPEFVRLNFYSLTRKQGRFEREIRDGLKSWHHILRWAHWWRYGNAGCLEHLASHTL